MSCGSAQRAWAQDSDSTNTATELDQILPYAELMAMRPGDRVQYIESVRQILLDLESSHGSKTAAFESINSDRRAWLLARLELVSILSLSPESSFAESPPKIEKGTKLCSQSSQCSQAARTCFSQGGMAVTYTKSGRYECGEKLNLTIDQTTEINVESLMARLPDPKTSASAASSAYRAFGSSTARTSTVSDSSRVSWKNAFATKDTSSGSSPATRGRFAASLANGKSIAQYISDRIEVGKPVEECVSKHLTQSNPKTLRWEACTEVQEQRIETAFQEAGGKLKESTESETVKPQATESEKPSSDTSHDQVQSSEDSEPAKPKPVRSSTGPIEFRPLDASPSKETPKPSTPTDPSNSGRHCKIALTQCDDPKKQPAKANHLAGFLKPGSACVIAGMVSQIMSTRGSKCAPVSEFPISTGKLRCSQVGQTMCNPMLFGIRPDGNPICLGRGASVTRQCSELSSPRDADRYLSRAPNGIREMWDEFRSNLAGLCDVKKAASASLPQYYCNECNVLRQRIADLNSQYRGGCKDPEAKALTESVKPFIPQRTRH